ncbi:capsule biosynthesis protein [Acidihalobacter aeolianus]|uniref:Capsule biosynthesis protein n=1 Tax=Acidihalobacter aeolianus TaxID=2792603 RepID=A0A1D8K966_9GAMM|nr:capsule biosynthesis protein [Acidihalobacter aeolianus]AOV17475.1 capsule biosynthesis protein [Acidihalobacter aeolianus]
MFEKLFAKLRGISKLFMWVVIVPTTLSILYFGLIASPVYISESRFVIYSPNERVSSSGLAGLLSAFGGSNSTSAAQTVSSYVNSWDAMMALNRKYNLKMIFGNDSIDIFDRFGGVFYPFTSDVKLLKYYRAMVSDTLDSATGISELHVRAYTAKDAHKLNEFLLNKSQEIVNMLNEQARQKAVSYAENNVAQAEAQLKHATLALAEYRNMHAVFSPPAQSKMQLDLIANLQTKLISEKTNLDALLSHAPNNPQIPVLRSAVRALEREIAREKGKVTGSDQSLASKDIEFEQLTVNQLLAEKLLEAAFTSLQQARVTAQKQELYLETISRPNLPDAPQDPKRIRGVFATLVISLMIWGVLYIVIGGIKEHHDN